MKKFVPACSGYLCISVYVYIYVSVHTQIAVTIIIITLYTYIYWFGECVFVREIEWLSGILNARAGVLTWSLRTRGDWQFFFNLIKFIWITTEFINKKLALALKIRSVYTESFGAFLHNQTWTQYGWRRPCWLLAFVIWYDISIYVLFFFVISKIFLLPFEKHSTNKVLKK